MILKNSTGPSSNQTKKEGYLVELLRFLCLQLDPFDYHKDKLNSEYEP